jgi:hypothetical protein
MLEQAGCTVLLEAAAQRDCESGGYAEQSITSGLPMQALQWLVSACQGPWHWHAREVGDGRTG